MVHFSEEALGDRGRAGAVGRWERQTAGRPDQGRAEASAGDSHSPLPSGRL